VNNKTRMASVSLVGAIPGIALSVVLIMAMINYFEHMSAMYRTLTGLTLVVSVGLSVLPVLVMVFGPKTEKIEAEEEEAGEEEPEEELIADEADEEEESDLVEEEADDDLDDFSDEESDAAEDEELIGEDDDDELDFFDEDEKD